MGVFWVVMRVLACGGLGVLVWELMTQQVSRRKDIEVSIQYNDDARSMMKRS